jgi:replication-associated recombination protein RarA
MESFDRTLLEPEFDFDPTDPPHSVDPLPCDRWLASSALQKAIRRGEVLTAERALRTLYRYDPRSTWRRLLVIACEDVGIASLRAVLMTARRRASAWTSRETERNEATALATARALAEAPKLGAGRRG